MIVLAAAACLIVVWAGLSLLSSRLAARARAACVYAVRRPCRGGWCELYIGETNRDPADRIAEHAVTAEWADRAAGWVVIRWCWSKRAAVRIQDRRIMVRYLAAARKMAPPVVNEVKYRPASNPFEAVWVRVWLLVYWCESMLLPGRRWHRAAGDAGQVFGSPQTDHEPVPAPSPATCPPVPSSDSPAEPAWPGTGGRDIGPGSDPAPDGGLTVNDSPFQSPIVPVAGVGGCSGTGGARGSEPPGAGALRSGSSEPTDPVKPRTSEQSLSVDGEGWLPAGPPPGGAGSGRVSRRRFRSAGLAGGSGGGTGRR